MVHGEYMLKYVCTGEKTVPVLAPKVGNSQRMGFQPSVRMINNFNIFLGTSYEIRRFCMNGIAATIEMEAQFP